MIVIAILGIVAFVLAVVWSAHAGLLGMTLNMEVKPLEVISLSVNIAIVFLLQYYLANKITDLRSEKDILIDNIADILSTMRACRDTLSTWQGKDKITPKDSHQVIQLFRRLSNGITHLEDSLNMSQCGKLSGDIPGIWQACDHYKYSATCAPFPLKPTSATEQDRSFRALSAKLQSLVFKINKHH